MKFHAEVLVFAKQILFINPFCAELQTQCRKLFPFGVGRDFFNLVLKSSLEPCVIDSLSSKEVHSK